jgi:hypothetical protein
MICIGPREPCSLSGEQTEHDVWALVANCLEGDEGLGYVPDPQ